MSGNKRLARLMESTPKEFGVHANSPCTCGFWKDHMSTSREDKRDLKGRPGGKVKSVDIREKFLPGPEQKQRHRQGREVRAPSRHS